MPELPEVETTLRGVVPHLQGRRVRELVVHESRLRWPLPDELVQIEGAKFVGGRRRGKYMLFETERGSLMVHLGMSGSLRILDAGAPWKKHDHVAFCLDSGKELRFHDPRRFGSIHWITGDPARHPLLAGLGPEPFDPSFSAADLYRHSRAKSAAVKSLIMDSGVVVGVGNIYACESLFLAGIRPSRRAGVVSLQRYKRLVECIRQVLGAAIEMGGTTLRDFVNEKGQPGYFQQSLLVYDREGEACLVCGSVIRRTVLGQRATYFCPNCQK